MQEVYQPNPVGATFLEYYRTQFEILKSRRVVEPVAAALGVAERPEFARSPDPIDAFAAGIAVEPVRESRLVRVSVESSPGHGTRLTGEIPLEW